MFPPSPPRPPLPVVFPELFSAETVDRQRRDYRDLLGAYDRALRTGVRIVLPASMLAGVALAAAVVTFT